MSGDRHPIWKLLDELQMNNRADAAKLIELRSFFAGLALPDEVRPKCPHCGLTFAGQLPLDEHVYHSHAGAEPAHWLAIEARSVVYESNLEGAQCSCPEAGRDLFARGLCAHCGETRIEALGHNG